MLSKERYTELRESASECLKIFIVAKESYQYCHYLHFPSSEQEVEYLNKSRHFSYFRHILWRNTVIEICKLLSKGDKYSIIRLINKLKSNGEYSQAEFSTTKVEEWEVFLNANEADLAQLRAMRDSIYSHTDSSDKRKGIDGVTFDGYKKFLEFIEQVLISIYGDVFDSALDTDTPIFDRSDFNIIKILAEEKRNRIAGVLNEFIKKKV